MADVVIEATAEGWHASITVPTRQHTDDYLAYTIMMRQCSSKVENLSHADPDPGKAKAIQALMIAITTHFATALPDIQITPT
jgi:hypothetical protein